LKTCKTIIPNRRETSERSPIVNPQLSAWKHFPDCTTGLGEGSRQLSSLKELRRQTSEFRVRKVIGICGAAH